MNKEKFQFESNLVKSAASKKTESITATVINHCKKSGFIEQKDFDSKSDRYKWLMKVIEINLLSLNLLDQIIMNDVEYSSLEKLQTEINEKSAAIIRDIAKRLMASPILGQVQVGDNKTSSSIINFKID